MMILPLSLYVIKCFAWEGFVFAVVKFYSLYHEKCFLNGFFLKVYSLLSAILAVNELLSHRWICNSN